MVDGLTSPKGQGFKGATAGVCEPLLVLVFLFAPFVISFGTGKTHVAFIDAIFTEILLTRHTLDQFIGLNFRPT
jgi:hypothetical protein